MASLREQILARIAAALAAAAPGGAKVFRAREVSITRADVPAITVLMVGETSQRISANTDRHLLRANLAIFVRGDPWDTLADAVATPMHQVVMADAPLQAMALDIRKVESTPEAEEADRTAGTLSCLYEINYLSNARDISAGPF